MNKTTVIYGALAFSLLVNAFMFGMATARAMRPHFPMMMEMHGHPKQPPMVEALPVLDPADRAKVAAILKKREDDTKAELDHMRDMMNKVHGVLTAPSFDDAALNKLRQDIENQDRKLKDSFSAVVVAIAKALPDDQRIRFFNKAKEIADAQHEERDGHDLLWKRFYNHDGMKHPHEGHDGADTQQSGVNQ